MKKIKECTLTLAATDNSLRNVDKSTVNVQADQCNFDDLIEETEKCTVEALNNDDPNQDTHENIDETNANMNANQCLRNMNFEEAFQYKRWQNCDDKHIQDISSLWPTESPSAYTCVHLICHGISEMKKNNNKIFCRPFTEVMKIFFRVFVNDEQKKAVGKSLIDFVKRIKKLHYDKREIGS